MRSDCNKQSRPDQTRPDDTGNRNRLEKRIENRIEKINFIYFPPFPGTLCSLMTIAVMSSIMGESFCHRRRHSKENK